VGVTVLSATLRNFETQSKTAEMPSRLTYQHGNEINREQCTTGVDRVLLGTGMYLLVIVLKFQRSLTFWHPSFTFKF
jgi:hypothetical protein